jgi:hypothetical protein
LQRKLRRRVCSVPDLNGKPMSTKIPLSQSDLQEHLEEQLQFLEASAEAFDRGFEAEAKRLAVTIRVLVHDTPNSRSVLGQLGMKGCPFVDTAEPLDPDNFAPYSGLVAVLGNLQGAKYVPFLDDILHTNRTMPFEEWWAISVFIDGKRRKFSRGELVLTAANQDGGAHVDPGLNGQYEALSKKNAMGVWFAACAKTGPMANPERAAIRQIAHELLKTLRPGYSKNVKRDGLTISGIKLTPVLPVPSGKKMGRNERCFCGSGRKFKHCHGRLASFGVA